MGRNYSLQLMVTRRCPLSCPYCYVNKLDADMSRDVADRAIDFIFSRISSGGKLYLNVTGGEPLLLQDLVMHILSRARALCAVHSCDLRFYVNSSGYLPPKIHLLLAIHGTNTVPGSRAWLEFSIDGPPQFHNVYRKSPAGPTYSRVYENAIRALRYAPVFIRTMIFPEMQDRGDELLEWFDSMFARGFWIADVGLELGQFFKYSSDFLRWYSRWTRDLLTIIREYFENGQFILWRKLADNAMYVQSSKAAGSSEMLPCGAGERKFFVDTNGDVFYCTLFRELRPDEGILGNVLTGVSVRPLGAPCPLSRVEQAAAPHLIDSDLARKIFGRDLLEAYLRQAKDWL